MVSKLLVHLCQLSVEKRLAYLQDVKTGIDCIARLKKEELEICTNKTLSSISWYRISVARANEV